MRVGYVCTNFNNSSYTRKAVESLYSGTRPRDAVVVVVDNSSRADDGEVLRAMAKQFPGVHLILSPENVGYFPGLNLGIHHLRTHHPDVAHIVVGNNDLEFPATFVEFLQRDRDIFDTWAVIAPDIIRGDGLHQNPHVLFPISRTRRLFWEIYYRSYRSAYLIKHFARVTSKFTARKETLVGHQLHHSAGPIALGYGACYILGPKFFDNFDRLYAPTFMMQEEFFLGEQLKVIGQTVFFDPRFVIYHRDHATMDALPSLRHWQISRDAYVVYKRFLALSPHEREARVTSGAGRSMIPVSTIPRRMHGDVPSR
jgi:GT2 family glycosyltransferase